MPYRTPAKTPTSIKPLTINEIVNALPLLDRSQAKINLAIADLRDECSDLYAEAFDRFFPGAELLKALGRVFGGSMAYSRAESKRELVESKIIEKHKTSS